ncbi:MAG: PEP-CTERM sorting domain-containing protein [Planctomycetota bacterium]
MKRVLVSMLVLGVVEGLVARAAVGTEVGTAWHGLEAREDTAPCQRHVGAGRMAVPLLRNAASDNILLTASAVTVFEIQDDAGPTYIVCLETASQPSDKMTDRVTYAAIADSLPEPMTIAMLGLSGFALGRRKTTHR